MTDNAHRITARIASDHPSAAGHFPGNPLVPGVVLLDEVIAAARDWLGELPTALRIEQTKFLAPIGFGEHFDIYLKQPKPGSVDFKLLRDEQPCASGRLGIAPR